MAGFISHGLEYVGGSRRFYMDLYGTASVGSTVCFQLEVCSLATSANYPVRRHRRYQAVTTVQNGWVPLTLTLG